MTEAPGWARACLPPLALLLVLAGCEPSESIEPPYYRVEDAPPPAVLVFAPARVEPFGAAAALRRMAARLPERAWVVLEAGGELAVPRARAVSRLLQRPVELLVPAPGTPRPADTALLVVQMEPGLVYDACRGPGRRPVGDLWPGSESRGAVLLPAGCATGSALAAQVEDPADLVRGRPLPPGASAPFAAAIEKYYRRNDGGGPTGAADGPVRESSTQTTPVATPASTAPGLAQGLAPGLAPAAAAPAPTANPLLGPLTR